MKVLFWLVIACLVSLGCSLQCHLLENEKCIPRDYLVETNLHGDIRYYPFLLKVKKCLASCETFNEPMLRKCWGNKTERIYAKVYDIVQEKFVAFKMYQDLSCSCKCKFTKDYCSEKQTWNPELCRCEPFIIRDRLGSVNQECTSTITREVTKKIDFEPLVPYVTKKGLSDGMIVLIILFCLVVLSLLVLAVFYWLPKRKSTIKSPLFNY